MDNIVEQLQSVLETLEDLDSYIDDCENSRAYNIYTKTLGIYCDAKAAQFKYNLKQYEPRKLVACTSYNSEW